MDSIVSMPYDEMVSDLHGSKPILEAGLKQAVASENLKTEAEIRAKLSTVTHLFGEREASFRQTVQAIALFKPLNEPKRAGGMYCSIGYQMKRRDMAKANEYMRTGIAILEKHQDTAALESGYNNYGVLKEMENLLDSAKFYYPKSYAFSRSKNDSVALPCSLNHLAVVELLRENFT